MDVAGRARTYVVHVPQAINCESDAMPLLIVLHGEGGSSVDKRLQPAVVGHPAADAHVPPDVGILLAGDEQRKSHDHDATQEGHPGAKPRSPPHSTPLDRSGAGLERIGEGIMAAEQAGLVPIKLNSVVAAGYNEADVMDLARLTLERDWHVRFIELMPLGGGECATLSIKRYVSNIETRRRIEAVLGPLRELEAYNPADEARNYRLEGARGVIGFISPVSEPYCGTCNRMRLTADGKFHLCLLNDDELDVRRALRAGDADGGIGQVTRILLRAVQIKPTGHHLLEGRSTKDRSMYQLGG